VTRSEEILKNEVVKVLRGIMIPEKEASVYDLDMICDIQIEEDSVRLVFSPHAHLCSSVQVAFNIRSAVRAVSGVRKVEIHVAEYQRVCFPEKR